MHAYILLKLFLLYRDQAFFRGAVIRKTFKEHRVLMVRHEKLRAQKRGRSNRVEKNAKQKDKPFAV